MKSQEYEQKQMILIPLVVWGLFQEVERDCAPLYTQKVNRTYQRKTKLVAMHLLKYRSDLLNVRQPCNRRQIGSSLQKNYTERKKNIPSHDERYLH